MIKNILVVKILTKVTSISTDYKPVTFISRSEYLSLSLRQNSCLVALYDSC